MKKKQFFILTLIITFNLKIQSQTKPCIERNPCEIKATKLYVFIGKKIREKYIYNNYCGEIPFDQEYKAKYKIIKNIYGDYPNKKIEFYAYEHGLSVKRYSDYEYILLYVAEYCGKLQMLRYQYQPLYKTKNGDFASPYNYYHFKKLDSTTTIKPQKIEFKKTVSQSFKYISDFMKIVYPEPYYEIKDNKVIAKYGNYPEELFEIKKSTVLKKFGFFK